MQSRGSAPRIGFRILECGASLARKRDSERGQRDDSVQVVVLHVDHEEAQDIAVHDKSEDRDDGVDDAEDDQVLAGVALAFACGEESDKTAQDMDDIMDRIHREETEERAFHDETGDAHEGQNGAENPRQESGHREEGKNN